MVTRTYMCTTTGVVFEKEQRITEDSLVECSHCAVLKCVPQRLIEGGSAMHFIAGASGGWSNTGYSKNPTQRRAESVLGRKLLKSEK